MPSITRKCLEVHNIAPKCLDMLAIAQRTEPPGSLAIAPEPRQNHAGTAPEVIP